MAERYSIEMLSALVPNFTIDNITSATVRALTIRRCGVMCAIKEFFKLLKLGGTRSRNILHPPTHKLFITYNGRIELDLYSFRMIGRTRTNEVIGWVDNKGITARVSNRSGDNPFVLRRREVFQENMLDTPKTARSENGNLRLS